MLIDEKQNLNIQHMKINLKSDKKSYKFLGIKVVIYRVNKF